MRFTRIVVPVLLLAAAIWASPARTGYVTPTGNNVGVFRNCTHDAAETPLFKVNADTRLLLIATRDGYYEVRNADGAQGWVEKKYMTVLLAGQKITFDNNAEISGQIEDPSTCYVIDASSPDPIRISLDRSFKESLKENVGRAIINRMHK